MAVNVLVCVATHPDELIGPSDDVIVGVPHASLAVAVPKEELIEAVEGLQASATEA